MKLKHWLAAMAGAATLGLITAPAEALPATGIGSVREATAAPADVQKIRWSQRRYYRHYYGPRWHYGPRRYYYGPRYRHRHHFRGPGFGFYFGPPPHRRHWRYRHW